MTELKPCKSCGKKALPAYMEIHDHKGKRILYSYGCPFCFKGTRQFYITQEEAIVAWNKQEKE